MRPDDIKNGLKNVNEKYISESDEDNAKEYFKKIKPGKILYGIAAAVACLALAAFIGVNIYNANAPKISPSSQNNDKNLTDLSDNNKENAKATLTVQTYNKTIANVKTSETFETDEYKYNLPVITSNIYDYDISYMIFKGDYCRKFEDEYVMNKTEGITRYYNGKEQWTYRIDEGSMLYYTQSVKDGVVYIKNDGTVGLLNDKGKAKWETKPQHVDMSSNIYERNGEIWLWEFFIQEIVCYDESNPDYSYSPVVFMADVVSAETGEHLYFRTKTIGVYGEYGSITCIGMTEDGFIFKTYRKQNEPVISVIGFDGECKLIISFEDKDRNLYITDAEIIDNVLYLSGTMTDKGKEYGYFDQTPYTNFGYPFYLDKLGEEYYKTLLCSISGAEKTDSSSFMLVYSLDDNKPLSLHTAENSYGGKINKNTETSAITWDTIRPQYTRKAIFDGEVEIESDTGRAYSLYFNNDLEPLSFTEGEYYACISNESYSKGLR